MFEVSKEDFLNLSKEKPLTKFEPIKEMFVDTVMYLIIIHKQTDF